jgi:hypothetical protein
MRIQAVSDYAANFWQAEGHRAVADLGGSIITGIDGNPLAVLAAQLNIPLHDINTAGVPLYLEDGREADTRIDSRVSPAISMQPSFWSRRFLSQNCIRIAKLLTEGRHVRST